MKKYLYWLPAVITLIVFIIWTVLVKTVDVIQLPNNVGPLGFYHFNTQFNDLVQQLNTGLYDKISSILMYVSFISVLAFGIVGLVQLIKRKSLLKVDPILYVLLLFYVGCALFYFVFDLMKINYSPLSTVDDLKASYPSTHVFISISFMTMGFMVLCRYFNLSKLVKWVIGGAVGLYSLIVIFFRFCCGKHYFTDIIGAIFFTACIICTFYCFLLMLKDKQLIVKENTKNKNK